MDQATGKTRSIAAAAYRLIIGAGLLLVLAANLPGHLSYDSVLTLVEARTGLRQTWAPAVSSWILRPFDALVAGTGLYVTASAALLFGSLMSLTGLRPRASWAAAVLAVLLLLTPQLLIYQGIVWRDVLFANLSVAGFVMLAHAARRWSARPWAPLAGALACLALAALVRQNGLILLVAGAVVLAWTARGGGRRAIFGWGLGSLVAAGALALVIGHASEMPPGAAKLRLNAPILILEHYDIVGAKAHHPSLTFDVIKRADPARGALLEAGAAARYSQARVDSLDTDEAYRKALWQTPDAVMNAQWRDIVLHNAPAYLLHRADVFKWVVLTPRLELCLPVQVGVEGPTDMLTDLDLVTGMDDQDRALSRYAARFYGTPIYAHLTWMLVAAAAIALLLRRRDPADWMIIGLLAGSFAFVASFALISVACDYRYLYLMDLAAMTGALYVALDPPGRRRPA